jgi:hypothetical protein
MPSRRFLRVANKDPKEAPEASGKTNKSLHARISHINIYDAIDQVIGKQRQGEPRQPSSCAASGTDAEAHLRDHPELSKPSKSEGIQPLAQGEKFNIAAQDSSTP